MLELRELSLQVGNAPEEQFLLREVGAKVPKGNFVAILGPSGCGKSTLLKVVAGLHEASQGQIMWNGRDLSLEGDFEPQEIGYVPQFSVAYEHLSVEESLQTALDLRVGKLPGGTREEHLKHVLADVGLEEIAGRRVQLLSGGQRRRLALALELVSSPKLLLCDEVTSGLDPKAEDEMVRLMHKLSRRADRIVLSVTHSLRHMELYDRVLVLFEGHVAYFGKAENLLHYFDIKHHDDLFPRLALRRADEWHRSWGKYRAGYNADLSSRPTLPTAAPNSDSSSGSGKDSVVSQSNATEPEGAGEAIPPLPSTLFQIAVLLRRRWRLFFRDRGQLLLQVALLFGFPLLVVIFAMDGLPQLQSLVDGNGNFLQQIQTEMQHRSASLRTGSLVSGLIMFQVVLLALMGSNNAAREIASERLIFEKEKFAGLRPLAYVASKVSFLGALVLAQSVWMAVFVNLIVQFPGSLPTQILLLSLVNAALTATCLGLSSLMRTAEQASLVSVYLVGFQLPLSGAVLALPESLAWITRPLIASYWGWAGFIQTLRETRFFDAVQMVSEGAKGAQSGTSLASVPLAVWVLGAHVILGITIAYAGCKSSRWE